MLPGTYNLSAKEIYRGVPKCLWWANTKLTNTLLVSSPFSSRDFHQVCNLRLQTTALGVQNSISEEFRHWVHESSWCFWSHWSIQILSKAVFQCIPRSISVLLKLNTRLPTYLPFKLYSPFRKPRSPLSTGNTQACPDSTELVLHRTNGCSPFLPKHKEEEVLLLPPSSFSASPLVYSCQMVNVLP